MSMLIFYVGDNSYAIHNCYVLRIVPKVALRRISVVPFYLIGLLNLEGRAIPVIDFCQLIEQRPNLPLLSSRIILVKNPKNESEQILGILGEKVENVLNISLEKFVETSFQWNAFPYLDRIYTQNKGVIQYLNVEKFFCFLSKDLFYLK